MDSEKRIFLRNVTSVALTLQGGLAMAQASKPFKVGLLLPMTGPFSSTGKQIENGVRLYMSQFGDTVAGRKVEICGLAVRSDGWLPALSMPITLATHATK